MRILIDTLGAPESSGGMHRYAAEVIDSWAETFPEDEIHVLGHAWVREHERPGVTAHVRPVGTIPKVLGQWLGSGVLARRIHADALLSVSNVVSPLVPQSRRFCVVHDWRHVVRSEEFGRAQRAYRRARAWSVRRAGTAFQISEKTDRETHQFAPGSRTLVVENGRDHARRWGVERSADPHQLVTFGHFVNKRADLVVRALAELLPERPGTRLTVLGARGERAEELGELARSLGIGAAIDLPGYVPDGEYHRLVASAAAVVLASTDEGFGLPVCEANYLGTPCVVASDSGLPEIHTGRVVVADPEPHALAQAIGRALDQPPDPRRSPNETWAAHVTTIRSAILARGALR